MRIEQLNHTAWRNDDCHGRTGGFTRNARPGRSAVLGVLSIAVAAIVCLASARDRETTPQLYEPPGTASATSPDEPAPGSARRQAQARLTSV
jgi:hypothetical protein